MARRKISWGQPLWSLTLRIMNTSRATPSRPRFEWDAHASFAFASAFAAYITTHSPAGHLPEAAVMPEGAPSADFTPRELRRQRRCALTPRLYY